MGEGVISHSKHSHKKISGEYYYRRCKNPSGIHNFRLKKPGVMNKTRDILLMFTSGAFNVN